MSFTNSNPVYRLTKKSLHIDWPLFVLILCLICFGITILFSASNENMAMVARQAFRLTFAFLIMSVLAFVPPHRYKIITPWLYALGLGLLIAVMLMGKIGKGAQRWLDLGFFRFQPSEIMKLAVPMMVAWYFDSNDCSIRLKTLFVSSLIIFVPALLIAKQPDLGTAIMVSIAGCSALFLAGLPIRVIVGLGITALASAPIFWHFLHGYQKNRLITLINPEHDPLGTGYHIIQSKIAIGSGGFTGKGWLAGSQSHLNFLPEHATDFIFAVNGEEFGFLGGMTLIILFLLIGLRGLQIAFNAQTNYTRLLSASLALSFFMCGFVNMGMVMGILPVVGIPLPLVSYGGTAMLTFLATIGIMMSISTHKILFNNV